MTLSIFDAASRFGSRTALVTATRTFSYDELARGVAARAAHLAAAGLLDSRRTVALVAEPSVASIELLLACFEFDVPVLVVHPRLPADEARELARRAGAGSWLDRETAIPAGAPLPLCPATPASVDPELPLVIVPTSGSTGRRKLVLLSRRALLASAAASQTNLPLQQDDRWLLCLPLAHVGGLSILVRSLVAGAAVVLFEPSPRGLLASIPELGQAMHHHEVTVVSFVPAVLDALLETQPEWTPPEKLRAVLLGGAATPLALLQRAATRGIPVLTTYGLTEMASQVCTTHLGETPGVVNGLVGAGHPLPGVELAIDTEGRIRLRGPMACSGYADDAAQLEDGWFITEDRGALGPNGELFVLGRTSDRLVTGGENVDPALVEAVLCSVPGVRAACVFGIEDARFGEIVVCAVVPDADFDRTTVESALRQRLAPHEVPRQIALLDSLPLNASGKVDRERVSVLAVKCLQPW